MKEKQQRSTRKVFKYHLRPYENNGYFMIMFILMN